MSSPFPPEIERGLTKAVTARKLKAAKLEVARRQVEAGLLPGETRSLPNPVNPRTVQDPLAPGEQYTFEVKDSGDTIVFPMIVGQEAQLVPGVAKRLRDTREMRVADRQRTQAQTSLDRNREIVAGVTGAGAAVGVATIGGGVGVGALALDAALPGLAAGAARYAYSAFAEGARRAGFLPPDVNSGFNTAGARRDARSAVVDLALGTGFGLGTSAYQLGRASLLGVKQAQPLRLARLMLHENEQGAGRAGRTQLKPNILTVSSGPYQQLAKIFGGWPLYGAPIRNALRVQAHALGELEQDVLARAASLNATAPMVSITQLGDRVVDGYMRLGPGGQTEIGNRWKAIYAGALAQDPYIGVRPHGTKQATTDVMDRFRNRRFEQFTTPGDPVSPPPIGSRPPPTLANAKLELAAIDYTAAMKAYPRELKRARVANREARRIHNLALAEYEAETARVLTARQRIKGSVTPGPKPELPAFPTRPPALKLTEIPELPKRPRSLRDAELRTDLAFDASGVPVPTGERLKVGLGTDTEAKVYEHLAQFQNMGTFIGLETYQVARRDLDNIAREYVKNGGSDPQVLEDIGLVQAGMESDFDEIVTGLPGLRDVFKQNYDRESALLLTLDSSVMQKLHKLFPTGEPRYPEALAEVGEFMLDAGPETARELIGLSGRQTGNLAARAKLASVFEDPKNWTVRQIGHATRILNTDQTRKELGLTLSPGSRLDDNGQIRWSTDGIQTKRRQTLETMLSGSRLSLEDLDNFLTVNSSVEGFAIRFPEAYMVAQRRLALGAGALGAAGLGGAFAGGPVGAAILITSALGSIAAGRKMFRILADEKFLRKVVESLQPLAAIQAGRRTGAEFGRGVETTTLRSLATSRGRANTVQVEVLYFLEEIIRSSIQGQTGQAPPQSSLDLRRQLDARRVPQVGPNQVPRTPFGASSGGR